jgi:2-dehydropantoate 2-reductase
MKLTVIGAGGVGGYVAARLAAAGADVHVVARGAHLTAIREHGLRVDSVLGDVEARVHATSDAGEIGPSDVVLFTVKAFDTDEAARTHLPPLVGADTAVVSLQNGVDNEARLAEVVGWPHVVGGLAFIFSGITQPGVVTHTGGPARLEFGELDGRRSDRVTRLHEACVAAGIEARVSDDVRAAMWHKYAFICAQAGTTAAVRLPIGEVRDTPASWELFRRLLVEVYAVAAAEGIAVGDGDVDRRLEMAGQLPGGMFSSLHDDLVGGRRMELEALHGTVLRLAGRHGLDVPATSAIHAVLAPWAARNRPRTGTA